MCRQHPNNQNDKGDVRPLQPIKIGQIIREQDAQRNEKNTRPHGLAFNKQQEDSQQQQVVGHGYLGAHRHRTLQSKEMWRKHRYKQHQNQKAQQHDLGPAQAFDSEPETREIIAVSLQHRHEVAYQETDRKEKEIWQKQPDKGNQMQSQRALVNDGQSYNAPYCKQQRRKPTHRGKGNVKPGIEDVQLRTRRLVNGKHRVDEHQLEHRREQKGIKGGLHRQQVQHQQKRHSTQSVHLANDLVGSQNGVEKHRLESHQQHGKHQHGWRPEVKDIGHQVI